MILPFIEPRLRRHLDRLILIAIALLMAFSVTMIYCAKGGQLAPAARQGIYFVVGIVLMSFIAGQDYVRLTRFAAIFYWVNIALLLLLQFAPEVKGSSRWLPLPIPGMDFKLQPSEFAKTIIIITLSAYVTRLGPEISTFPGLIKSLLHIALPVALIMEQPDLGTSLVIVAIWLGIVFLAGAKIRHLLALTLAGVALFAFCWQTNIFIKPYQKGRILALINPEKDARGKGYQILQSLTAIGGGQATGQGFGKGLQTRGNFIPENNTDFIFTVIGEETGFVGASLLLAVYGLFLWRGLVIIAESEDPLGRLMAGGILTLLTFHVGVNIGMTCGLLPVVGVPLPLVSFGGSAAWANLSAVGLLLSISMRRHKLQF